MHRLLLRAATLGGILVLAQDPTPKPPSPPLAAAPADVASVEAIVAALYDVISGPAGQKRDWERMRSLFHAEARLVPLVKAKEGGVRALHMKVDDYVQRSGPMLERDGFFEQDIARRIDRFGDLAHVFSTYAARRKLEDKEPFLRGMNSLQLCRQGGRWWVLQLAWEQEADGGPIPAEYLPGK